MPVRQLFSCLLLLSAFVPATSMAADTLPGQDVEAVTVDGAKVVLHPNGRWDYVDTQKAKGAKEIAQQYPENQGCPPGWRGGLFGIGRCIPPTDPDFSKGSHIGK